MPDVNLLKDTQRLDPTKPPPRRPAGPGDLTQPEAENGQSLGGWFRSLFNRRPSVLPTTPSPETGKMTLNRGGGGERILSEKRSRPAVIPLPEDEGSYNVNLLSEELTTTVNPRQRAIQLGLVVVGAAMAVGLIYGGLTVYGRTVRQQIQSTQQELSNVKRRIAELNVDQQRATATTQKLAAIRGLIDQHTRWTNFFRLLEKYTLPSVTYGASFAADQNGVITLAAKTTSYDEIARQYLIWQQLVADRQFISNFTITGANAQAAKEGTTYSFTMTMTLLPTVIVNSVENAQVLRSVQASAVGNAPIQP